MLGTNNDDANEPATVFPSEILAILEPRIADLTPMERVMLSDAYLDTGRTSDAVRQFDKAISTDSSFDTAVAHANIGQRLLRAKALPEALPHLQRAYELDPQNMTYMMDYQTAKVGTEPQKRPAQ
jgi:tetratricopeptide (TPR) repeat protein